MNIFDVGVVMCGYQFRWSHCSSCHQLISCAKYIPGLCIPCCSTHTQWNAFVRYGGRANVEVKAIEFSYTKFKPQCSCFQTLHSTNNKQRIELELRNFSIYLYRLLYYYYDFRQFLWPVNSPVFPVHISFFLCSLLNCLQTYSKHRATDCFIKVEEISVFPHIDFLQL